MNFNLAQDKLDHLADFQRRQRVSLMCMVCTELLNLPRMRQRHGDAGALRIIRQHDHVLRDLIAAFPGGLEINASGGAFFLVFDKPSDAVRFMLLFQVRIGLLARKLGEELAVRAGIHVGEVLVEQTADNLRPGDLNGLAVDTCLALQSLAGPGRILMSPFAFENARQSLKADPLPESGGLSWFNHGAYELLLVGGTVEVCEVVARRGGRPALPEDNAQARRVADQPAPSGLAGSDAESQTSLLRQIFAAPAELRRPARAGAAVAAMLGAFFLLTGWLDSPSYDLAYLFRPRLIPPEVAVVEMDQTSSIELGQERQLIWNRRLYARLLQQLDAAGARAVGFDVRFVDDRPASESGQPVRVEALSSEDREFREELTRFGRAVLSAELVATPVGGSQVRMPADAFRDVSRWGVVEQSLAGRAYRRPFGRMHPHPSLNQSLALIGHGRELPIPQDAWLNFYGPPGTIAHYSFAAVLSNSFPRGAFSNRVVLVGANMNTDFVGQPATDRFVSPYTRWTGIEIPGVEINATSYANLVRGDWLRRLPPWCELLVVLLVGGVAGYVLVFFNPARSVSLGLLAALVLGGGLMLQVWLTNHWFPWLVLSAVSLPAATVWAVVTRTRWLLTEDRKLRNYLSTHRTTPANPPPPEDPHGGESPATVVTASPPAPVGNAGAPAVPDHEMLKCIGKGGYGEVWLARDILGSFHAVKIIRRAAFHDAAPFEREFKGLQLYTPVSRAHPGLVHILHVGRNDSAGFLYYMMEAGDGEDGRSEIEWTTYKPRNLGADVKRRGALPLPEVLDLAVSLTEALAFLHGRGLIHRDLKPTNIIFVQGRPKLADVGLVTQIATAGDEVTFIGTHGYLPLEGPGAPSADIFSLGKLLYVALTGRPVDQFPDIDDAVAGTPEAAHVEALVRLLLRAGEPIAAERYQTAEEFLADLRRLRASVTAAG